VVIQALKATSAKFAAIPSEQDDCRPEAAAGQETMVAEKLNQVIENQNKIIDYLNQVMK
jgi:hypothetical protein